MRPILYSKDAPTWTNLGLGTLTDCIRCHVFEKRNGAYELEMKYPISGVHYGEIAKGMLVKAKPNDFSSLQMFRIYKISKPMNGQVTIKAEHISYELNGMPIPSLILSNTTPESAVTLALMGSLLGDGGYHFNSNINTVANIAIRTPSSIRAILGGVEGSVLDVWGGEYEFDNRVINLYAARGADRGVHIKYGRNLTDLQQEESIEKMYTHVYPYARVTENDVETFVDMGASKLIDLNNASALGFTRCLQLDLTDEFGAEETVSAAAVRTKAQAYIASHNLTVPAVNLTVSFYALRNSDEYRDLETLEKVKLCDTVHVDFEELGVSATAKVIATTYDVLLERYDSIELGDARSSFAETVLGQQAEIESIKTQVIPRQISRASAIIDSQTKAFAEKMYNGLGLYSSTINDITYYHDTPAIQDADYIITINTSGVAFARTVGSTSAWNDGNPNWLYGVDSDGGGILATLLVRHIIADIITSGRLESVDGSVYFDLDNSIIHTQYDSGKSQTKINGRGVFAQYSKQTPDTLLEYLDWLVNGYCGVRVGYMPDQLSDYKYAVLIADRLSYYKASDGINSMTHYKYDGIQIKGEDILYYKSGDTFQAKLYTCYAGFFTGSSSKSFYFSVRVNKSLKNISNSNISVSSMIGRLDTVDGYAKDGSNANTGDTTNWKNLTGITVSTQKIDDYNVRINIANANYSFVSQAHSPGTFAAQGQTGLILSFS